MKKLSLNSQYYLFKNLSDLFISGFSIKDSLYFLSEIDSNKPYIEFMTSKLSKGYSFSTSISGIVNNDFYNQIMISEKYGDLTYCLNEISAFIEIRLKNHSKIKDLLFYPVVLIIILIAIAFAISEFVLPQLNSINYTQKYDFKWIYLTLFLILIIITILFLFYKRLPLLRKRDVISRIPLVGNVYKAYIAYILSLELKMLIRNGIDLKSILHILEEFKPNTIMYLLGQQARDLALKGDDLSILVKKYAFVPTEFIGFFNRGTKMSEVLIKLEVFAQIKFDEMNRRANQLINLIQPLLFLIIGICIIAAYLVVLMPIYSSLRGI